MLVVAPVPLDRFEVKEKVRLIIVETGLVRDVVVRGSWLILGNFNECARSSYQWFYHKELNIRSFISIGFNQIKFNLIDKINQHHFIYQSNNSMSCIHEYTVSLTLP
eukprot:87465_1